MIKNIFRRKPREIVLGRGETIVSFGEKGGRRFVFIRPTKTPGKLGSTPPEFEGEGNISTVATSEDTIIWLDGSPEQFIETLRKAYLP